MAQTKIRVTQVDEVMVESAAAASFIIDLVNKQQTTYSEAGWSLEELGKHSVTYTAEVVSD